MPRPTFELRIVDGDGDDVAAGEPGEVVLRGGSVMLQYLDDPAATAEVLSPDGWLRTGDVGVLDDAGNLRIVGRSKDMFIVGGFNAYPAEIENALLRHPDIEQVAVIGIPDDRLGEVGMAFVVARPGTSPTAASIIEWSRATMANYKVPRAVDFVDELPYNATGKVVKTVLRERAAQRAKLNAQSYDRPSSSSALSRAMRRTASSDRPASDSVTKSTGCTTPSAWGQSEPSSNRSTRMSRRSADTSSSQNGVTQTCSLKTSRGCSVK